MPRALWGSRREDETLMNTDPSAARNGNPLPLLVPRVICIGLDMFGRQVLTSFHESHLPNLQPACTRLTVALQYNSPAGFAPLSFNAAVDWKQETVSADVGLLAADAVPQDNLVQQLHQSRQKIAAQGVRSDLIQRGYRIGQIPEVYLFVRASEPGHIDALRAVAMTTRAYLRQYDPVRITAFVCLADIENPLASPETRANALRALDQLLMTQIESESQIGGEPILDRGYVVSQETSSSQVSGQGCIPDSDLAYRTAGFLAAHYLNGLRQPMTAHEHRLFGASQDAATTGKQVGLCHLFGYADLRFEVSHILEWCATRHSSIVLNQELLRTEPSRAADNQAPADQDLQLRQGLRAASLPVEAEAQVNYILQGIGVGLELQSQPPSASIVEQLDYWRARRRAYEQLMRDAERRIEGVVKTLAERYRDLVASILDDQITTNMYGLAQAEALLDAIAQWCRKGQSELATTLADQAPSQRQTSDLAAGSAQAIQQSWLRLFAITEAIPDNTTLIGRFGLVALFALILVLSGDTIGLVLAAILVLGAVAWLAYFRWWLPVQLQHAQQAYQQQLAAWQSSQLNRIVRSQLNGLYKTVLAGVLPPGMAAPDGGELRQQVATWRRQLQRAAEQCATKVSVAVEIPSLLRSGEADSWLGENLTISQEDFQAYYEQLTRWQPAEVAGEFLQAVRAKRGGWQTLSTEQIVDQLTKACRRRYDQQSHAQLTGLDLEYHLLDVAGKGEEAITNLLTALVESAAPMARLQRLHGYWERPTLRLLIVHNPEQSIFREPADQLNLQIVGGAHERQVICICTEHLIPSHDLAMTYDWRQVFGPIERQQSHA
jgi:hypothetical protein